MSSVLSQQLAEKIARGGAPEIVAAMLREAESETQDEVERVTRVMSGLEAMAGQDRDNAGCLMFALYPIASELMLHDVCDGIALWFVHNRSPVLVSHVKQLAASESDPDFKRYLEGLLSVQ